MREHLRAVSVVILVVGLVSVAIAADSVTAALAKVHDLKAKGRFEQIIKALEPFADSGNSEVEYEIADARLGSAIVGKRAEQIKSSDLAEAVG